MAYPNGKDNGTPKANPLATITHARPLNVIRGNTSILGQSPADAMTDAMELSKVVRTYIMSEFKPGIDYGAAFQGAVKPSLLKAGAQKIQMLLNCRSKTKRVLTELGNGHLEVETTVVFINRATGNIMSWGTGSATTMESKHRFRNAGKQCPECGSAESLKKSKEQGKGFYCWDKIGGCGATFPPNDERIIHQVAGKVENENPWDQRNTVLKMSYKRALVDAAESAACLSEFFTQDIDDAFTEDQIAEMITPPIDTVVNHKSSPVIDVEAYVKEHANKPKAPPTNPAAPQPADDVPVLGQRTPGHDGRGYLDVAKGAAAEASSQSGVSFTAPMCHNAVAKALLQSGATTTKPADSKEALKLIVDELYPKHRQAVRDAINTFFKDQIAAAKKAMKEAEPPAEPPATEAPASQDTDFEGTFDLNSQGREPGSDG